MPIFEVQLPTGRIIEVEGAPDEAAARARVSSFLQEERRNAPRTGSSLESGGYSALGGLSSAVEGTGRITGLQGLEEFGRRNRERFEAAADAALPPDQRQSFEDAETLGDYGRAAGQALGQNLPSSVPGLAGALAGAAAGSVAGPLGATGGALIGGLAASYPQLFGANRQRQMQENPGQPVDEAAAALTAIPQAALESVADRVTLGLAGVLGRPAAEVGRTLIPRIVRGLGLGAATEIPTEIGQQILERAQAGLDILSPEAMREYRETMFASGVTGSAMGGTASGVFGARPRPAAPGTTEAPADAPPEASLSRVAEPMPEAPEPIETPEEARAFLAANPTYGVPDGVTDEGLVVRANEALNGIYRDQVGRIRQETLADFLGARDVTTQPGELDAEGNPTDDVVDRSRQAQTFIRNVLNAQGRGEIPAGPFTIKDVTDVAMLRLGGAGLNKADTALVKDSIDGMVKQGLLTKVGKSRYDIPEVNVSTRGQPGLAPPIADQRIVPEVIERLGDIAAKPTKTNIKLVNDLASQVSPSTKSLIDQYLGFVTEARQLTAERQKNLNNVEELQRIEADLRDVALDQATILDQLEGIAKGTLKAKPAAEPGFTADVGRSRPDIPPAWAATDAAYRAEQQRVAQEAQDEAQFAQLVNERPQEVLALLQELSTGMKPRALLSNQRLREEAQKRGLVLTQQGATRLFNAARKLNFINGLGQLQNAPATQPAVATPVGFTTEKGSTYKIEKDGTTTRNKAARPEHPGDSGPKAKSERTVYLTLDAARALAPPADVDWRVIVNNDGSVGLITKRPDGRWGVSSSQRSIPVETQPTVGSIPLELWGAESINGLPAYKKIHFGNKISQINEGGKKRSRASAASITEQDIQDDQPADSHEHPAFEEPDATETSAAFMNSDEQGSAEPSFAVARYHPFDLDGLTVNEDGTFDYSVDINNADGAGNVTITGRVEGDAMVVQTALATRHARGKGYGIQAYQNLVDWAHARGLHFASDAMVSDSASNVYKSLRKRGYDVIRNGNAYRSGNSWISDDFNASIYFVPVSAPGDFAMPGSQPLSAVSDDELRQQGERTFRRVMGENGRLTIQDRLFIRDLGEQVQKSAEIFGISLDADVSGFAYKDLAALSLATAKSGGANFPITQAAIHEGWHVAENMKMFTPNEIRLLNANLDTIESVVRKYVPTAPSNLPPHEIRAYGLNARVSQKADFGSVVNGIYDKFVNFLERIGNFMRGQGFQTWRDVYDAFERGGMADRQGVLQERFAGQPDVDFAAPENIAARGGANLRRLANMLGPQLYGNMQELPQTNVKELLQNSFDAIKSAQQNGQIARGNIAFEFNGHELSVTDNGIGMSPQLLGGKFLQIAGSDKTNKDASGGFGIAKMLFLYANKNLRVVTMKDGRVSELNTTGDALYASMESENAPLNIEVRDPTQADMELFPEGHGTHIEIQMPSEFIDTQSGQTKAIPTLISYHDAPALTQSPLFANINVRVNSKKVYNVGSDFDADNYTNFANAKFSWGSMRIYISKNPVNYAPRNNARILSNGLWQFSTAIKKDLKNAWSDSVPFNFFFDVRPTVKPDESGYPFQFNRKAFTKEAETEINKIINYINAVYMDRSLEADAKSFGTFYTINTFTGRASPKETLAVAPRKKANPLTSVIEAGDSVEVRDGQLIVNGRSVPDLDPQKLQEFLPEADDLKIDPSTLDFDNITVHDNTQFGDNDQSVHDYMTRKFGARFQNYLAEVGGTFIRLRDAVARTRNMPNLNKTVIGVSLDKNYRGVSTKIPFDGSFINPLVPESKDTTEAAYGLIGTMIHELAHYRERNHNEKFPQEMQRILYSLMADKGFDFAGFQQDFVDTLESSYADIIKEGQRLFDEESIRNAGATLDGNSERRQQEVGNAGLPASQRPTSGPRPAGQSLQQGSDAGTPDYGGSPEVSFASVVGRLPADTATAHAAVKRAADSVITGGFKAFASPVMTMGKMKPELMPAGDTQRTVYTRTQEMIVDTESLLADAHKLPPASVAKITRVWEQASRTRKKPNLSGLTPAEIKALNGEMASVQHAFNYFIESAAIDNFMPTPDKPAAVRSRLETFWKKHAGKHLWEIPSRDLMAASPEGYKQMQKYERLRNPYYMPMVGRGTHFVAAYKAGPGGKRGELVGMVAYSPLNLRQRFRNSIDGAFTDPEADARAQLQREFGGNKYMIMERGQQFSNDEEARLLRSQGDFIAEWLAKFSEASKFNKAGMDVIRDMTAQLDKAQIERIFRPNRDILRAVTPKNESSYILDVMPQYLLSMSKVQARRYTQESFVRATNGLSQNDFDFLKDLRDYSTSPNEAFGGLRALAFFNYLGANFSTAVINLTQFFQTNAMLMRDGGIKGSTALASAYKSMFVKDMGKLFKGDGSFTKAVVSDGLTDPNEKKAVTRAFEQGIFAPVFTNESRGQFTVEGMNKAGFKNAIRAANIGNKVTSIFGRLMQMAEEYNRLGAFLGAYRLAQSDPSVIAKANKIDNTNFTNAYDYAVGKVIDSQYLTTKEDRAYLQRFTPIAEVATQFMSYPLKTMEQYYRHAELMLKGIAKSDPTLAKAGFVGLMAMSAPLIALAGIWALPGADWLKEWSERLIGLLWSSPQNFDADLRDMLGGGKMAEALTRGIPYAEGWMALNNRLAVNPVPVDDLLTASIMSLFGPAGGIAENAYTGIYMQAYQNGDYWGAAASLLPTAIGNAVKGLQLEFAGEQYTRRGNRVITPTDVERVRNNGLFIPLSLRQALGFPPPEFVAMRESANRVEEVNRQTRGASERISKELAGYMVDMLDAQRRGDSERMATANRRFTQRATEFVQEQHGRPLDRMIRLDMPSIQRRALTDFYGLSSEESIMRNVRRNARPEALRQREIYQPSN